jgi:hypothetical protein
VSARKLPIQGDDPFVCAQVALRLSELEAVVYALEHPSAPMTETLDSALTKLRRDLRNRRGETT